MLEDKTIETQKILGLEGNFKNFLDTEIIKILTINQLLIDLLDFNQKKIVKISQKCKEEGLLKSKPITSGPAYSNSKSLEYYKYKKGREIKDCLEELLSIHGIEIEKYPTEDNLFVSFYKNGKIPPVFEEIIEEKPAKGAYLSTIDKAPLEQEAIKTQIKNSFEVRLLQSRLYNYKETIALLRSCLIEGNLCKVKLLLGQPFSKISEERSATSNTEPKHQLDSTKMELENTIKEVMNLAKELNGKPKSDTGEVYAIELRMYYFGNPITLYQCRNKTGKNQAAYMGIFWRNDSSYHLPHIEIRNKDGLLIKSIEEHFESIWYDVPQNPPLEFNWHHHLGKQKTRIINATDDIDTLMMHLEKAYQLKNFSNYSIEKPNWVHFKCMYYNFKDEHQTFLLQIDSANGIARIKNTNNNNTYYGFVRKLHGNYSLVLHTTTLENTDRVIYINIPVGSKKLRKNEVRYAIYNNNDPDSDAPYTQVMLLQLLSKEEDFFDSSKALDIKYYIPNFRNKKIKIDRPEWTDKVRNTYKISGDYFYRFDNNERSRFYELLKEEISAAKSEICFLGYGLSNFPNASDSFMHSYLNSHIECLKNRVKIRRILLKDEVSPEFKLFLKKVKSNKEYGKLYDIYLTNNTLPILGDLVIIDPDNPKARKAILIFMQIRKNQKDNPPIKMEIYRKDVDIILNLHNTVLEFTSDKKIRKKLKTVKQIEKHLKEV